MLYGSFPVFPEDRDITICPAITSSPSVPSFRLQPSSPNNQFLIGSYDVPIDSIQGAQFDRGNNSNPALTCSKLSLLYSSNIPVGRGNFTVTYSASNGVMRRIHINYGESS